MLLITTQDARPDTKTMIGVAQALGWTVFNDGWRVPERLREERGTVYGGKLFCQTIAEQMNWKLTSNPINWLTTLPNEYVSRKIILSNIGEARKIPTEIFIKPTIETTFRSSQCAGTSIDSYLDDNIPLIVSDAMKFTSEYRCVVKNRQVITACCYWYRDKPMELRNAPAEYNEKKHYYNNYESIVSFVNKMLNDERVECVDNCVIDLGRFDKDKYAIFDSKPLNTSEVFGLEPVAMFDALKGSCEVSK